MHRLAPAGKRTEASDTFRFFNVRDCPEPPARHCHVQPCPPPRCSLRPSYVCMNPQESNQGQIRIRCDNCPSMREPNRQRAHRPVTQPGMFCDQGGARQFQSYDAPQYSNNHSAPQQHHITISVEPPRSRSCMNDYQTPGCTRQSAPRHTNSCSVNPPTNYAPRQSAWLEQSNMYMIREEPVKETYSIFPAYKQQPEGQDARRRNSKETNFFWSRLYAKHYPNLGTERASRPPVLHSKNSKASD